MAEECTQEAFERALLRWARDGVPTNPGAWLTTVARNRAVDRLRAEARRSTKQEASLVSVPGDFDGAGDSGVTDDRLRLIFTCCHPALSLETQVALTLRTLAGLSTAEIARAFLVPEPTMAKRLARAKSKIRNAGIPYRVPPDHLLPERTIAVLGVLYLLFNEGYSASTGLELVRGSLCDEAIRLTRVLVELMPDEPEALGLLALMLFNDSRRFARTDICGGLMPLEEQDRSRWVRSEIDEGDRTLQSALRQRRSGPYQIQAAIAGCHAVALTAGETNWQEILFLYDRLAAFTSSPVVSLNRAVALAMYAGPEEGLKLVDEIAASGALPDYHLLPATQADLLRRLGRNAEAASAYIRALELVHTEPERAYLVRRLQEVSDP